MKFVLNLSLFIVILAAAGYFVTKRLKPEIEVAEVTRSTAVDSISANVKVLSAMEVTEKTLENGRVTKTVYIPGTGGLEVKKGDIICEFDTGMLEFEINKTQNQVDAAAQHLETGSSLEPELENLIQDYEQNKKLSEINQFPESELKKQLRNIERTRRLIETERIDRQTNYNHQKEHLAQLKARKERMSVRASIDGLLTESYAFVGSYIYAGSSIAKIISNEKIIEVSISEEDFPGVALGQPVAIKFLGLNNQTFHGEITYMLATADARTKRRSVYISLKDAPEDLLVSGMTGEASITKQQREDAIIIPIRALLGRYVYVLEGDVVRTREVKVGYRGLRNVEIISGLDAGELVAVDNLNELKDGDTVTVRKRP